MPGTMSKVGEVIAVCISENKGEKKTPVSEVTLKVNFGVEGDGHAEEDIKRQVSLLAEESVEKMIALGLNVGPGAFAENITTSGLDMPSLPIGTLLSVGKALLKVSQIGKVCHDRCNIYKAVGDCVMPREGIFAQVIEGGKVKPGDRIAVLEGKK